MKILTLTDLHAKTSIIPHLSDPLKAAGLVILCGDITHFGHEKDIAVIVRELMSYNPHILGVTGNCDYPATEKYLAEMNLSLSARVKVFGDYQIVGLGGSLPCPGRTPQEYSEEEYRAVLESLCLLPGKPLILVSHQPPYGTLNDRVPSGSHVGSKVIRHFIEKHQPVICYTGHIHEGVAIDHICETVIVNPGPAAAGNYAESEIEGNSVNFVELRNLFHGNTI